MRCISCNKILSTVEMSRTKDNGEYEDLCGDCSNLVNMDIEGLLDCREYAFEALTNQNLPHTSNLHKSLND